MQKVSDLFQASAYNPCQVANLENGNAGFRIPEYQRTYDWSSDNIRRLMTEVLSGFERLSRTTDASAFTFLGTLILVRDQTQEPKFKGRSFSVVDGQQRLTTLTLISCALIEQLRMLRQSLPKLRSEVEEWLDIEADQLESSLADCVFGVQKVKGNEYHPFPRIVRSNDTRSDSARDETMRSGISMFLNAFSNFIGSEDTEFLMPDLGMTREAKKIIANYEDIKRYCRSLNDPTWYEETDCQFLDASRFQHGGCKQLWEKTRDVLGNDGSSAISSIEKQTEAHAYFRTLMLGAYFCNCIAVTTVVTSDETAAFDIFDTLNTTGEPLTALETLKPKVIRAENDSKDGMYVGSECEIAFDEIDKIMAEDYPETKQKQDETKDVIITFALYLEGKKITRELSVQRRELHRYFERSNEHKEGPTKFMKALSDIVRYRSDYWVAANSGRISGFHADPAQADQIKLLSAFIGAMRTSMILPILSRYWISGKEQGDFTTYFEALKAVSAFLALRRSATGGTDGIDTCFRDIMETGTSSRKFGLCAGPTHQNRILEIDELKKALRSKLVSPSVRFASKDDWINHVVDVPIYSRARPLARFLLFSATHHTALDSGSPGQLTRDAVVRSDDRIYLSYERWASRHYRTVEHVAPNSDKPAGWDPEIYATARPKNTLGNLVLLPAEENSSIGNATWSKKKIFYSALTDRNIESRRVALESAKRQGMQFNRSTEELILGGERFSMLDGINDVGDWNAKFIQERSRRLATLAWDKLRPWLD